MKGRDIPYSPKELAWIKRHGTLPRREAHARFCERFNRRDISFQNFTALCIRKHWRTGRTGQFPNGHLPHNTKWLGHERLSKEGYVELSIAETNPHTGFWRRYVLKHQYGWERQHGPVPAGHVLKCLDGNRRNTDPANWTPIPRALLPFLNGHHGPHYDQAAPAVKPAILTLAKLKRARYAKTKETRQ